VTIIFINSSKPIYEIFEAATSGSTKKKLGLQEYAGWDSCQGVDSSINRFDSVKKMMGIKR
jgi:hypothetical protein